MSLLQNVLSVLLFVLCIQAARAELILTAPPRESAAQGKKLYGPLARHISEILGEPVTYRHPKDWLRYQRDIRRDKFDIVFDGPHFVSWRILRYKHTTIAKLPGNLDFYFISLKSGKIKKPQDLELRKVCVIPPPNLTSLVLLNVLNSAVREPHIYSIKGGMKKVVQSLLDGECEGAVVRKSFYDKKLSPDQKKHFRIIHTSNPIPNQAITVSQRVKPEDIEKISASLTRGEGVNYTMPIIERFASKQVKSFQTASNKDYKGQHLLLKGVVLGW